MHCSCHLHCSALLISSPPLLLYQVFHLLTNFLPHMLATRWHQSFARSGLSASLLSAAPALTSPLVGLSLDRAGRQLQACVLAGVGTCLAYLLLLFAPAVTPLLSISLLSMALAVIPTVTLAVVPMCVPSDALGLAYGSMEVADAVGVMVGNCVFGELYRVTGSYSAGLGALGALSVLGLGLCGALVVEDLAGRGMRRERFCYQPIPSLPPVPSSPAELFSSSSSPGSPSPLEEEVGLGQHSQSCSAHDDIYNNMTQDL